MNTDLSNRWGANRDALKEREATDRESAKLFMGGQKEVNDFMNKAFFGDGKTPPMVSPQSFKAMLDQLDPAAINAAGGGNAEDIAALRAGKIPDVGTAQRLVAVAQNIQQNSPGWFTSLFGSEAPNANDLYINQPGYMKKRQAQ